MQGEATGLNADPPPAGRLEARRIAVALGSNAGDRSSHLDYASVALGAFLDRLRVSAPVETAPEPPSPVAQRAFLNAAAVGWSREDPEQLFDRLRQIEQARGRARSFPGAPRTLDLDLILVGDLVVQAAGLTIPHPRFRARAFVLRPLVAIAPNLVDPVTGRSVQALLDALDATRT